MEDKLRRLFDFQRFVRNEELQDIIDRVEAGVKMVALSDKELDQIAAAGISYRMEKPKDNNN